MFQKDIQACEQKKYDLDQNTTLFWLKGKEVGSTSGQPNTKTATY